MTGEVTVTFTLFEACELFYAIGRVMEYPDALEVVQPDLVARQQSRSGYEKIRTALREYYEDIPKG